MIANCSPNFDNQFIVDIKKINNLRNNDSRKIMSSIIKITNSCSPNEIPSEINFIYCLVNKSALCIAISVPCL